MKAKNETAATLAGIVLFLCLPLLASRAGQWLSEGRHWAVEPQTGYRFSGTLENRLSAFEAYASASPHIGFTGSESVPADDELIGRLEAAALIPPLQDGKSASAEIVCLSPARYDLRFEYEKTTFTDGKQTLSVTRDVVSGTVMRIELSGAQETLSAWEELGSGDEMLRRYLAYLGYGRNIESFVSQGEREFMETGFALIPETYPQASVTISRPVGVMVFRLSTAGGG